MPTPITGGVGSSSSAISSASSSTLDALAVSGGSEDSLLKHIDRLRAEKRAIKEQRKLVQKNLKNAEKRKARLKKRARQLSNKDLFDVLQLREEMKSEKHAAETPAQPTVAEPPETANPAM